MRRISQALGYGERQLRFVDGKRQDIAIVRPVDRLEVRPGLLQLRDRTGVPGPDRFQPVQPVTAL